MSTTNKKVSSHFIELQPIDNILHKNDEDSKSLVHEYVNKGVNYLQTLTSERPGACVRCEKETREKDNELFKSCFISHMPMQEIE